MKAIDVGGRLVGAGQRCFVIAEAGSNHNGSLESARSLVRLAAEAGADAVKFQTFRAEKLYTRSAGKSDYLRLEKSIYDVIAEMEMPYEWLPLLAAEAERARVLFMSTPFDEQSADELDPYVPAFKIASYEMTHLPLVRHIARKGKPLIISTGTADLDEVRATVNAVRDAGNDQLILLQCTASYPAPMDALNLRVIETMRREFDVPVGLSDHSRDPVIAPIAAVSLGAAVIEKHFTFSNDLPGPDHRFAVEPDELRAMIEAIRTTEMVLGTGMKIPLPAERELRAFARRSIYTIRAIGDGEAFTRDNIAALRSGNADKGLPPSELDDLLGKRALRALQPGVPVVAEDVE